MRGVHWVFMQNIKTSLKNDFTYFIKYLIKHIACMIKSIKYKMNKPKQYQNI